jgi:hypothetical protein
MKVIWMWLLMVLSLPTAAQETKPFKSRSVFKVSPQHFTNHQLKVGLERFSQSYSRSVSFFLTGTRQFGMSTYADRHKGLGGELQYRKYISPMKTYTTKSAKTFARGIYAMAFAQASRHAQHIDKKYYYSTRVFTLEDYV